MFVFSVKADRKKIFIWLAVILLVVTAVIVFGKMRASKANPSAGGMKYSVNAATNEDRVAFLQQFGWKVTQEPLEIREVVIPEKFDEVYTNYNALQRQQGLDLMPYAGKTCKQWIYAVENYPQVPEVHATLLVFNNRVIGGDLSTAALDGFMTGFKGEQVSDDTLKAKVSSSLPASDTEKAKALASSTVEAKASVSSTVPANAWPTD